MPSSGAAIPASSQVKLTVTSITPSGEANSDSIVAALPSSFTEVISHSTRMSSGVK